MWTTLSLCTSYSPNAKHLYKFLIRECRKLPKDAQPYYKNFVRQGFGQHADEADPERVKQIMQRAVEDSKWILNKYCTKK
ncbi:hypothetical protein OUZ56_014355 [Daphnia magna]|uniref:LYR motif-containing protein 9 n=1 Tax=Daphnia magna TaxID=35525 RepID=A0ABR0AJK3_9CRUS|nr:hypothetical protein OUZ56_014355 [Daphnia magna]